MSLGHYAYAREADGLTIHLYAGGRVRCEVDGAEVRMAIRTEYPWDERIAMEFETATPALFSLRLRLPGWCRDPRLSVNGEPVAPETAQGYALVRRTWAAGDRVELVLPMPVERVRADPRVAAVAGRVALQRGPVVFCFEEADNGAGLAGLILPAEAPLTARHEPHRLGGCVVVEAEGWRERLSETLYTTAPAAREPVTLRAIPYALWANRGEGEMRVWIRQ
jgi:DUF1680 family protein